MTTTDTTGPLAGLTVFVTGASRGIGAATARALHRDGATVVLHYWSAAGPAKAIAQELGDRVHLVQANLSEVDGPAQLWSRSLDAVEAVDVLVNNAGAWIPSPMLGTDEAWKHGWDANLSLNLWAAADLGRLAVNTSAGGAAASSLASPAVPPIAEMTQNTWPTVRPRAAWRQ